MARINSRAVNLKHLTDALAALSWAATQARLAPLDTPPYLERDVLRTAARALKLGATAREVAAVTERPLAWVTTAQHVAHLPGLSADRQASL